MNLHGRLLALVCVLFVLGGCTISLPLSDTSEIETQAVKAVPVPKLFNKTYRLHLQQVFGFLTTGAQANTLGQIPSSYAISTGFYEKLVQATPAQINLWKPFVFSCCTYLTDNYYGLPTLMSVNSKNIVTIVIGNPDPNSLNTGGPPQFNLSGTLQSNGDIIGNPANSGGVTWNAKLFF